MGMVFTCTPIPNDSTFTVYGGCQPVDGKTLEFADRQSVSCGTNYYLSALTMTRAGCSGGNQQLDATCVYSSTTKFEKSGCITRYGDASSSVRGQDDQYFDRLDVFCSPGEAMQGLQLVHPNHSGNTFQYAVTCCK